MPSFLTVVLAVIGVGLTSVGAWVGWQQMQMTRVKLHHDLYDRRFKVFEATQKLLSEVWENGEATHRTDGDYEAATSQAIFLFDDPGLDQYLTDLASEFRRRTADPLFAEVPESELGRRLDEHKAHVSETQDWAGRESSELVRAVQTPPSAPPYSPVPLAVAG